MRAIRKLVLVALGLAVCLGDAALAGQPSFLGLGDLPGGTYGSAAKGVSIDGTVVTGWSSGWVGTEAFVWSSREGLRPIGTLDESNGVNFSVGYGVSRTGQVVGQTSSPDGSLGFLWTNTTGMVSLGDLPGGRLGSAATGISDDGDTIVGAATSSSISLLNEAFRWTPSTGMVGLGTLPGGTQSSAADVSKDGMVVVGVSGSDNGTLAFRWTAWTGMVALGDLPGGSVFSSASAVSADGVYVVGESRSAAGPQGEAFLWSQAGGMIGLGDLSGGAFKSRAFDVSSDGRIVVGQATSAAGDEAFVWDPVHGMRSLRSVLVASGVDLTGWRLTSATAMSADGLTIVGEGVGPRGPEAWIATIPEPATAILLVAGIAAIRRRAR